MSAGLTVSWMINRAWRYGVGVTRLGLLTSIICDSIRYDFTYHWTFKNGHHVFKLTVQFLDRFAYANYCTK